MSEVKWYYWPKLGTGETQICYVLASDYDRDVHALRNLAGELYQVLGALDAPANVLDKVSAAANGEPVPTESLLPFHAENYESLCKERDTLAAENARLQEDSSRLDFLVKHEAHVGWNREGDYCGIYRSDGEDGYECLSGRGNFHEDPRGAIDAARAALQPNPGQMEGE